MWGWFAIAGGIAVIAIIVTIILVSGDPEPQLTTGIPTSPVVGPSPSVDSAGFDQLVAQLPSSVVTSCQPQPTDAYPRATVGAYCVPADGTNLSTFFYLYPSEADLVADYNELVTAFGFTPDGGSCSTGQFGEQAWEGGGATGRVLCADTQGLASMLWTTDGFAILGGVTANGTDLGPVDIYNFWTTIPTYNVV